MSSGVSGDVSLPFHISVKRCKFRSTRTSGKSRSIPYPPNRYFSYTTPLVRKVAKPLIPSHEGSSVALCSSFVGVVDCTMSLMHARTGCLVAVPKSVNFSSAFMSSMRGNLVRMVCSSSVSASCFSSSQLYSSPYDVISSSPGYIVRITIREPSFLMRMFGFFFKICSLN